MKYFLFFLLIIPLFTISQHSISGKIINSKTKQGIPYATIGLIKKNVGTNANEEGSFQLTTTQNLQEDTLLISCTGYQALRLPVSTFTGGHIALYEDTTVLTSVTITPRKDWAITTLNDFSDCSRNTLGSNGSQTEVALHLQLPGENGYLKEVKICHGGFGLFGNEKTVFRVKIYEQDVITKGPGNSLCNEVIEVKTKGRLVKIDLENYRIFLPQKDFFVAVEWLKVPLNEIKQEVVVNGVKQPRITYRPSLSLQTTNVSQSSEMWGNFYSGKWVKQSVYIQHTSVSIAAIVKY